MPFLLDLSVIDTEDVWSLGGDQWVLCPRVLLDPVSTIAHFVWKSSFVDESWLFQTSATFSAVKHCVIPQCLKIIPLMGKKAKNYNFKVPQMLNY